MHEAYRSISTHHPVLVLSPRPRGFLLRRRTLGAAEGAGRGCGAILTTPPYFKRMEHTRSGHNSRWIGSSMFAYEMRPHQLV